MNDEKRHIEDTHQSLEINYGNVSKRKILPRCLHSFVPDDCVHNTLFVNWFQDCDFPDPNRVDFLGDLESDVCMPQMSKTLSI